LVGATPTLKALAVWPDGNDPLLQYSWESVPDRREGFRAGRAGKATPLGGGTGAFGNPMP